jgi:hypothetical protein
MDVCEQMKPTYTNRQSFPYDANIKSHKLLIEREEKERKKNCLQKLRGCHEITIEQCRAEQRTLEGRNRVFPL